VACERVGIDRAIDALELQLDRWEAAATVPLGPVSGRWPLTDQGFRPVVDPDVWLLHVRWFRRRPPDVRSQLLQEYERPALRLARRYYHHREPLEDLTQVAIEALLLALDRFDPRRRIPFLGFATPTIVGALKRHYRDAGWAIRVPRRSHELAGMLGAATEVLQQDLGRRPTREELAVAVDARVDDVERALRAVDARNAVSIEASFGSEWPQLALGVEDVDLYRTENQVAVTQVLRVLDQRERDIVHQYFVLELSQDEIARELGVSQMQVSRLLNRILSRLRARIAA
jgi:RNA polymerase sigma-B factor